MKYILLSNSDIQSKPPVQWLVHKVLKAHGLSCIFGKSGSGKTFLTLDMLLSIASGREWFGLKTLQVPVTYLCLESRDAIGLRIQAWEMANTPCPTNFKQIHEDFDFSEEENIHELANAIKHSQMDNGLIAIDTFNASIAGLDENSSKDMGKVLQNLRLLANLTNSAVKIVHHSGKDSTQGMRGHSSLHGALDTIIEVRSASYPSWHLVKNKDGESNISFKFKISQVELGLDVNRDSITSCHIEESVNPAVKNRVPSGKNNTCVFEKLKGSLFSMGPGGSLTYSDAIEIGASALTDVQKNKRNYQSKKAIDSLVENDYFQVDEKEGNNILRL